MNNNIVQIIKYAWALMTLVYLSSSCPHVNRRYDQVSKTCVPQEHVFSGWHLPSDALREIAWYDWKSDHTLLFVLLDYLSSGRRKVSLWSFSNRTHPNTFRKLSHATSRFSRRHHHVTESSRASVSCWVCR